MSPAIPSRRRSGWTIALFLLGAFLLAPGPAQARRSFTGANTLGVPQDFMAQIQAGLEMIYLREYPQALDHFERLTTSHPDSPVGHLGRAVAFQSMMLENYDFSFEDAYRRDQKAGYELVVRALKSPHQKAWNYFLYAALVGLDGIHDVREGDFLIAFNKGWDAVEAMKRARQVDPAFRDPELGVGIYNYWRTAITRQVPTLPTFGDHREEGLKQIRSSKDGGLLVWAASSFTLAFTFWEDRRIDEALAEARSLRQEYPHSVVNNMMLGQILVDARKYDEALGVYREIQRDAPRNTRMDFLFGDLALRQKRDEEATALFMKYLASRPPKEYQARTWYRLGQIRERAGDLEGAIGNYQMAITLQPRYPQCQRRLDDARRAKAGKGRPPAGGAEPGKATPVPSQATGQR